MGFQGKLKKLRGFAKSGIDCRFLCAGFFVKSIKRLKTKEPVFGAFLVQEKSETQSEMPC